MEEQHRGHGQAPQAVEGGEVGQVRRAGLAPPARWRGRLRRVAREATSATATCTPVIVESSWLS